jgi:GTP cyclohydrolase I
MITSQMLGHFRSDPRTRSEFLSIIGRPHGST